MKTETFTKEELQFIKESLIKDLVEMDTRLQRKNVSATERKYVVICQKEATRLIDKIDAL